MKTGGSHWCVASILFAIDEVNAQKIMVAYDYEWTDEEV